MPRKLRVEYPGAIYDAPRPRLRRDGRHEPRARREDYVHLNAVRARLLLAEDRLPGEHHSGELRLETAEAKAERIVAEESRRLDWSENDLAARRKSDAAKLAIAARLRRERTLSIKAIAARVRLGKFKSANARRHAWLGLAAASDANQGRLQM